MTRLVTTACSVLLTAFVLISFGCTPTPDVENVTAESSTEEAGTIETAADETASQPSRLQAEPLILRLHADGSVSRDGDPMNILSDAALGQALKQHRDRDDSHPGRIVGDLRAVSSRGRRPQGPETTIVAEVNAAYQALDELLRTCVDCGCEKFVLKNAIDDRSFSFALFRDLHAEGLPDEDRLPPMRVRLRADSESQLVEVLLNDQSLGPNLNDLQNRLISVFDRGPGNVQQIAEMEIDCDANLEVRYLIEALDAVTGFPTADGNRVALVERVRPVSWGSRSGDIEEVLVQPIQLPETDESPLRRGGAESSADAIEVELDSRLDDATGGQLPFPHRASKIPRAKD